MELWNADRGWVASASVALFVALVILVITGLLFGWIVPAAFVTGLLVAAAAGVAAWLAIGPAPSTDAAVTDLAEAAPDADIPDPDLMISRAIQDFSDESLPTRIRAVHTLKRVATSSPDHVGDVRDVLLARLAEGAHPLATEIQAVIDALLELPRERPLHLTGLTLKGVSLADQDLHGANFAHTDLTDANLSGADLRRANLGSAHLRGASLLGARLHDTVVEKADLRGASYDPKALRRTVGTPRFDAALKPAPTAAEPQSRDSE